MRDGSFLYVAVGIIAIAIGIFGYIALSGGDTNFANEQSYQGEFDADADRDTAPGTY